MDGVVRPAQPEDLSEIQYIFNESSVQKELGGWTFQKGLEQAFRRGTLVLFQENSRGTIIGALQWKREFQHEILFQKVGVLDPYRRMGVGTSLYSYVQAIGALTGRFVHHDTTLEQNTPMVGLLTSRGFRVAVREIEKVKRHSTMLVWEYIQGDSMRPPILLPGADQVEYHLGLPEELEEEYSRVVALLQHHQLYKVLRQVESIREELVECL